MRTLKTSIVLCSLLAAVPALAQQEDVQLQPEGQAETPAAADAQATPPGATATEEVPVPAAAAPEAPVDTPPAAPPEATGQKDQGPPTPSHVGPRTFGGPVTAEEDVWKFSYSGYFRAPMRIGWQSREVTPGVDQSETALHSPVIPDDQYLSWQQTRHNQREWAELFFTVGNSWASGTVALQQFQFTDASWASPETQFGISQGYVTLTPELPWENVRLIARVGSFWGRYGAAGKYDSGEYDTFLFGRTHVMGETLRLETDLNEYTLYVEHGIGTKRPNPNMFNRTRFTLLNHVHAGVVWDKTIELSGHYMHSWTQEEERAFGPDAPPEGVVNFSAGGPDPIPDGSLTVYGADLRADLGSFGYLYAGFSRIDAKYAYTVAPAIEVLHSFGGGEYTLGVVDNYFEPPQGQDLGADARATAACRNAGVIVPGCSNGNGSVNTILAQYEASLVDVLAGFDSESPLGEGQDLTLKFYTMLNMVKSDNETALTDGTLAWNDYTKFKWGVDGIVDLFPALSVAVRYDQLNPNSHIPEQSFSIVSPRLIFRSQFVTRETIELSYSRYMYEQRECPVGDPWSCVQPAPAGSTPEGFGSAAGLSMDAGIRGAPTSRPDENVIKLQAYMWW